MRGPLQGVNWATSLCLLLGSKIGCLGLFWGSAIAWKWAMKDSSGVCSKAFEMTGFVVLRTAITIY